MPMWRCPHCGTPQAETARCWVCRRSSTACGTCRNFRRSVAGSLGYCGLDRRRQPLAGDEIRACWEAWPGGAEATVLAPLTIRPAAPPAERAHPIEFVEVGDVATEPRPVPDATAPAPTPVEAADVPPARIPPVSEPGWSLGGEIDR